MTPEQKQLLLKDLSARLPYVVICETPNGNGKLLEINTNLQVEDEQSFCKIGIDDFEYLDIDEVKPYLRPMSSMTEEENSHYINTFICMWDAVDWLNEHHFDYRGLIGQGLALEAPEDMYKTE